MGAVSGKNSTIGGSCYYGTRWNAAINTESLDGTSFCSAGWKDFVEGLKSGTWSISTFDLVEGGVIYPGSTLTLSNDYVTVTGTIGVVESQVVESPVNGLVTFEYSGNFTGEVTMV